MGMDITPREANIIYTVFVQIIAGGYYFILLTLPRLLKETLLLLKFISLFYHIAKFQDK